MPEIFGTLRLKSQMKILAPNRRTFLGWILGLPGVSFLSSCIPFRRETLPLDLLSVVCSQILPSEDGPGAKEAGVAEYVRKSLSGDHARLRPLIEEGLSRLDRLARREWGASYVRLSSADQDRILGFVQKGGEDSGSFKGGSFVHRLVELSLEGFLGDPVHGGNRNEAGWKFIGLDVEGPRPGQCGEKHH